MYLCLVHKLCKTLIPFISLLGIISLNNGNSKCKFTGIINLNKSWSSLVSSISLNGKSICIFTGYHQPRQVASQYESSLVSSTSLNAKSICIITGIINLVKRQVHMYLHWYHQPRQVASPYVSSLVSSTSSSGKSICIFTGIINLVK